MVCHSLLYVFQYVKQVRPWMRSDSLGKGVEDPEAICCDLWPGVRSNAHIGLPPRRRSSYPFTPYRETHSRLMHNLLSYYLFFNLYKKEEKYFSNNADVCCLQNCAVCRKKAEKMHTMIIHFCLLFLSQCKKSSRISQGDLGQSLTIVVPDAFKL